MIDFSGVRFTYDGASYALDGVSAHIAEGEFACILGGNGSGKSTLAKHVNALLAPDAGSVSVAGMDTADPACTYLIRQTAGMVFQNPDDQLVASLVEDDVAFGPENLGVPTPELHERVTRCLAEVGLAGFERRETHALSGGQKQRVAIAGVLAMNPRILILDEASAMLDPRGRDGLMRVCRGLHNQGFTIMMITHFMEEAAQADRVIVMDAGKVVCEGAPADVLTQTELLASLNLEVPFAARLSLDLRAAGVESCLPSMKTAWRASCLSLRGFRRGAPLTPQAQEMRSALRAAKALPGPQALHPLPPMCLPRLPQASSFPSTSFPTMPLYLSNCAVFPMPTMLLLPKSSAGRQRAGPIGARRPMKPGVCAVFRLPCTRANFWA